MAATDLTCRWIIIILCYFFFLEQSNWNKMAALTKLANSADSAFLTTSDQLKEKLWINHHQTFYMDIRWHKLGWCWFSAISEKQDGRHSQFSTNIVRPITAMPFKLSSPDLTCRWIIIILCQFFFLEQSNWNKMAALTKLSNSADSTYFTTFNQLKKKL